MKRVAVLVVLAVTPGLLAVSPVLADLSSRVEEPRSGVPVLSLPEETEALLPGVPATADGRLSVPEDASAPVPGVSERSEDELPDPDHELVERRDAVTEVWQNTDGTQTITIHDEPIHFQAPGSSAWQGVDNSLVVVPGRAGWVQNAANDWSVRFGPVQPGGVGGVEVVTDAGLARFAPELDAGDAAINPVVGTGENADTVTYPDVWPGVDVVYTVTGARVKEDIVVRGDERSGFPFVTEGLGLVEDTSAPDTAAVDVTGPQGAEFAIAPVEVIDGDEQLAGAEADADLGVEAPAAGDGVVNTPVAGTPQRLTVSVDEEWLAEETAGDGQVVVDPTGVVLDAFNHTAFKSDGASCTGCGVKFGNSQGGAGGAPTYWRTAGGFSYWSSISGKQLLYAGVWMNRDANPQSSAAQPMSVYWATGSSYAGAIANGDAARKLGTQTVGDSVAWDVTSQMQGWQYFGLQNEKFGFSGAETTCTQATTACYTYRSSTAALVLNVNTPPPAPGLVAPANDSLAIVSTTPTLKWNPVIDADASDTVKYTAMIATGSDAESGMVATGPESTATTWQIPAGVLRDGVTYYWKVYANDGTAWTQSAIRKITVDRAGVSPPSNESGGVSTNLITGNSSLGVAGPSLPTVGGSVGVSLSYETQPQPTGLLGEYRVDEDHDHVIEASDDVTLVRTDPQISFDWSGAAASPSRGVPNEYYTAKWTGTVALPALSTGGWKIGARSDDGVRVWIDDVLVVDQWQTRDMPATPDYQTGTTTPGAVHDIRVEYFQSTGVGGVELWARKSTAPDDPLVVPAEWLASQPRVLPKGWRLNTSVEREYARAEVSDGSVTLVRPDGTAASFAATGFGFGYTPPKGNEDTVVVNPDGTVMVQAASGNDYLFAADGTLKQVTSAIEDQNSPATQATYDSSGRVTTLTDPVSDQDVTLTYAPNSGCEEDPPVLGGETFEPAPTGYLCKVTYWDSSATQLYYKNGLLGYVRNPGSAFWGYSYNTNRQMIGWHDPLAFDAAYSGARSDWDKLLVELAYDTSGRVTTVTEQPPLQGAPRPAVTYTYTPTTNGNGELTGGSATVTRAGVAGTYRSVGYDARGRQTSDTDAAGLVTTTTYNAEDQVTRTDEPGSLRSTTLYDAEDQPVDEYGPAPASMFNANGTGQTGVPHEETSYDEGIDGLAVAWWNNPDFVGAPLVHQHDPGSLDSNWGTGSPAPAPSATTTSPAATPAPSSSPPRVPTPSGSNATAVST